MISVKLSYIASTLGWRHLGPDVTISQVTTDSRSVAKGDCFIALYGDNFDAHQFVTQVIESGAAALIVSKEQQTNVGQLIVEDTRLALGQLAQLIASLSECKKIAITGSCGKTTVKEMLAAILSKRFNVLATKGNFNNDIGVPLTLLRLTKAHDVAVVEIGANHVGEIDYSSGLVQPDVAIITNIGAAHLEGFGSIDGVVEAKSEIYHHLPTAGVAIFDGMSKYASRWQLANQQRKISRFYVDANHALMAPQRDVSASDISLDDMGCASFLLHSPAGDIRLKLALPGKHNVANALAASAGALALDVELADIARGLSQMGNVAGRLNISRLSDSLLVIDDSYNANASSITAAIELLAQYQGLKIVVLGEMGELGDYAVKAHQSIGPVAQNNNINVLMTVGELSRHYGSGFSGSHLHFENKDDLSLALAQQISASGQQEVAVLVKGSRSAKMEDIVQYLQRDHKQSNQNNNKNEGNQ